MNLLLVRYFLVCGVTLATHLHIQLKFKEWFHISRIFQTSLMDRGA